MHRGALVSAEPTPAPFVYPALFVAEGPAPVEAPPPAVEPAPVAPRETFAAWTPAAPTPAQKRRAARARIERERRDTTDAATIIALEKELSVLAAEELSAENAARLAAEEEARIEAEQEALAHAAQRVEIARLETEHAAARAAVVASEIEAQRAWRRWRELGAELGRRGASDPLRGQINLEFEVTNARRALR